jgi:hypothetical protein
LFYSLRRKRFSAYDQLSACPRNVFDSPIVDEVVLRFVNDAEKPFQYKAKKILGATYISFGD